MTFFKTLVLVFVVVVLQPLTDIPKLNVKTLISLPRNSSPAGAEIL
jgi:hypothetical protein